MEEEKCGVERELDFPLNHKCILPKGHDGDHRCFCWDHWKDKK